MQLQKQKRLASARASGRLSDMCQINDLILTSRSDKVTNNFNGSAKFTKFNTRKVNKTRCHRSVPNEPPNQIPLNSPNKIISFEQQLHEQLHEYSTVLNYLHDLQKMEKCLNKCSTKSTQSKFLKQNKKIERSKKTRKNIISIIYQMNKKQFRKYLMEQNRQNNEILFQLLNTINKLLDCEKIGEAIEKVKEFLRQSDNEKNVNFKSRMKKRSNLFLRNTVCEEVDHYFAPLESGIGREIFMKIKGESEFHWKFLRRPTAKKKGI